MTSPNISKENRLSMPTPAGPLLEPPYLNIGAEAKKKKCSSSREPTKAPNLGWASKSTLQTPFLGNEGSPLGPYPTVASVLPPRSKGTTASACLAQHRRTFLHLGDPTTPPSDPSVAFSKPSPPWRRRACPQSRPRHGDNDRGLLRPRARPPLALSAASSLRPCGSHDDGSRSRERASAVRRCR